MRIRCKQHMREVLAIAPRRRASLSALVPQRTALATTLTTARITACQALAVASIVPPLFAEETKHIMVTGPGNR